MKNVEKSKVHKLNQKVFDDAHSLIPLNKYLMSALGLWPNNQNDIIFVSLLCYCCYSLILGYVSLYYAMKSFNIMKIIGAIMENIALVQIFVRLYTMRRYNKYYGKILDQFSKDFSIKNYQNAEEQNMFLSYNVRSKFFINIVITSLVLTAILYYTKPLLRQLR
jgi:hypothetical protein